MNGFALQQTATNKSNLMWALWDCDERFFSNVSVRGEVEGGFPTFVNVNGFIFKGQRAGERGDSKRQIMFLLTIFFSKH